MDEIIKKARELGELIVASPEMKRYKDAEIAKEEDETAKTFMLEYNMKLMNINRDLTAEKITQEEANKLNQEAFTNIVEKCDSLKEFIAARADLEKVTTQVNNVLSFYITGKAPGGCSGNCSSCSGGCN